MPTSADVNWAEIVRFPTTHPYYKEYERRCLEARLQPAFIQDSWELIIRGLQRRAEFIAAKAWNLRVPEFVALDKLVAARAKELMMPPVSGTPLALWSGGIQVSQYVRGKGYDTLESTVYGGILDKMTNPEFKLWLGSDDWGPQGALWDTISARYVEVDALPTGTSIRRSSPPSWTSFPARRGRSGGSRRSIPRASVQGPDGLPP